MALSIEEFLAQDEQKDLLRLLTAGSVDDGKSTLIGRLLFDSKRLYEDQLQALERDSKRVGNAGDHIDYALLCDGLKAEREQGITIDVAYRYFSTNRRKFIIADTPGHEQYTRNMITGGSTANLAIILVDARTGVVTQTCRHSYLVSLLGIRHLVLAVNKMDLVDFSQERFDAIVSDYKAWLKAQNIDIPDLRCIPLSALEGDNVVEKSANTPWYKGESLMEYLETVPIDQDINMRSMRFPVQYVLRPNLDFRGFAGKVASGVVKVGDEIDVYVISFDADKHKISLGYKTAEMNPWNQFMTNYNVGDVVDAKVVKLMTFGAFAEILPGVDGLIHISQIANKRIGKPEDVLAEGQEVQVKITDVDAENKRISLSIRALLEPEAEEEAEEVEAVEAEAEAAEAE